MERYLCLSGTRFTFNCYICQTQLVVRAPDGTGETILVREGVTKGDPLAMLVYGLGTPPLIKETQ